MKPEHWLYTIPLRFRSLFRRRRVDEDLDEELRDHLARKTEDFIAKGMSAPEARRSALIELGGIEQAKEECRDTRRVRWLQDLLQDLRFALRMLRKSPGFTAVAVLTLALGIGANTAIFTMMNGLMLHTLPVRDPGQLVELLHQYPGEPAFNGFSWDAYRIMRDGNHVFSDLIVGSLNFITVRADKLQPQTVFVGTVGGTFFQALGVRPAAGRLIGPEDVQMGYHSPVAVISWSFWKSRFDLDPGIIGKKILVGDAPLAIIGVTQRGFYGLSDEAPQDIWWPISLGPSPGVWFGLLGRLKPGVTIEQARAEMSVLFQEAADRPDAGPFVRRMKLRIERAGNGVTTPLTQMLSTPLTVLMATVGMLLLLACANLAGLLLARGASRQHEMAVRACLGAARARLLRQTLTESLLLSLVGCAVGIFLAYFATRVLIRVFASGRFVRGAPVHFQALTHPDSHVLLFTGAIALLAGLLCGAAPAMSASNTAPAPALQQASRIGESKSRRLFGKGLVASQVALSLVLVSSAGLFVEYLSHLRNLNLGFERNNLLLVTLDFAQTGYTPARFAQRWQELIMRLDAIPGVTSATFSDVSPMEGPGASSFASAEDHPEKRAQVSINYVAPDYFETYGTQFLAGRDFSARDQTGSPVAIINEAAARDCFGNENPIGRHITLSHITLTKGERTYEVVGLVRDAKYNDLQQPAPPTIYADLLEQSFVGSQLAIRTKINPGAVAGAVRQTESAVLNTIPIVRVTTMNAQIDSSIVPQRLIAMLSAGFGALGALLAAIGLYGLLAYIVTRRTHEIGVRMALGATRSDLMHVVLRDALWMVCAGLALGAPLAFWAKSVAASLIRDLPARSPISIVFGGAVMIVLGLVAAYVPARRATRVDPMVALRYE
ncbi:MAG TPA: ABC transporter permease [Candidatus Acidoferrales bacterium]|nr:ABC transporter permease [Candidatus Acidoferrales bacterium]